MQTAFTSGKQFFWSGIILSCWLCGIWVTLHFYCCITCLIKWCKLSLAGAATGIVFVVTNTNTCLSWQNTYFVMTKVGLSWQAHFCCEKHVFVMTKHIFCPDKSMLVATTFITTNMCLSWQIFVARKIFCCDKHNFIMTKVLSQQVYFCCNKRCVLSWQMCLSWQKFCHNKNGTCGNSRQW